MTQTTQQTTPEALPPVVIDTDQYERLRDLAFSTSKGLPDLSEILLEELDRASIVDAGTLPADVITVGSTVMFSTGSVNHLQTVTLVYPEHADISKKQISILTPIGVALIGLSEGAEMMWETRAAEHRTLRVHSVSPPSA